MNQPTQSRAYHESFDEFLRSRIPVGSRVLDLGCSTGDRLAMLAPSRGVGLDTAPLEISTARRTHSHLEFHCADPVDFAFKHEFDFVILSDLSASVRDIWATLRALRPAMTENSRLLVGSIAWWRRPFERPRLSREDVEQLLTLAGFRVDECARDRRLTPFSHWCASPSWNPDTAHPGLTCSVIVPCRNERGNIADIFSRTPELGGGTELIFVDGNSTDGTVEEIESRLPSRPRARLIHQGSGTGKGDAVRKGFEAATGDVLAILDADLTVPPEDLPRFFSAIAEGTAEFVNGSRLLYPMEVGAMRPLNLLGNYGFGKALSAVLGIRIKDALCGTKVLRKETYARIAEGRAFFGDFDPFGDFDLLFGAARLGLKIVDMPVRYRARTYGETKISRFRDGFKLVRMTAYGWRKLRLGL